MNENIKILKQTQTVMILFLCSVGLYFLSPLFSFISFYFTGFPSIQQPNDSFIVFLINGISSLYSGIAFIFAGIIYIFLWIYYGKLKKIGYQSKMLLSLNILLPSLEAILFIFSIIIFAIIAMPTILSYNAYDFDLSSEVMTSLRSNIILFIIITTIISFIKNVFYFIWGTIILSKLKKAKQAFQLADNEELTATVQENFPPVTTPAPEASHHTATLVTSTQQQSASLPAPEHPTQQKSLDSLETNDAKDLPKINDETPKQ